MRVLLVGPHWDTGRWTEYCAQGLQDAGHDVRMHCYSQRLERPIGLWGRVRRRLKGPDQFNVARVFEAMRTDNLDVLRLAARHRPEFTLVLKGEVLLPETIERLRNLTSGPVVQWCGDDPSWFPNIMAAAHLYDRFYLADPTYAPDLEPRGVEGRFMPHAAHPAAWTGQDADAEVVDVVFVGDARHNMGHLPANRSRVAILEAVARSGVSLAVWGRGWEKLEPDYRVREAHRGLTLLPAAAVARAYRSARIVLNVHHAQMREGPNMRTFEIPAAGAFQLTDFKARMPEFFEIGTELATYQDADDVAATIELYLNDESTRRAITAAGKRRVECDHSYAVRMRQLIEDSLHG
ncbi:MAG: glycosyltransferase [Chloroflexi bacterium]|nr:glycosyltransferase [Chloroflexota bacterium]